MLIWEVTESLNCLYLFVPVKTSEVHQYQFVNRLISLFIRSFPAAPSISFLSFMFFRICAIGRSMLTLCCEVSQTASHNTFISQLKKDYSQ